MNGISIARRYAEALFDTVDVDHHTSVRRALLSVKDLFDLEDAYKIFSSPVTSKALKYDLIKYALDKINATSVVCNFFRVVIDSDRIGLIPLISDCYEEIIRNSLGIHEGSVISATPLANTQIKDVKAFAEDLFETKLNLSTEVNSECLGGFIVKVGNRYIDLSLKTRLEELKAIASK